MVPNCGKIRKIEDSYLYDAWGNCTIGTNVNGLADLNPIRYRGYYYDKETQLYYLQTRYYDPATGRFISPDTVNYLKPKSIHGLNLYAYCFNNPVMGVDPTGHFWENISNWFTNTGRVINDWFTNVGNSIETFIKNAIEDVINYNIDNTNEQAVIEAHYFSAYKGVFVVKLPFLDSAGFSFGFIGLGTNVKDTDTVKHEYGHILQLKEQGFWDYLVNIAAPSVAGFILQDQGRLPYNYFALPWEYEADLYGGVNRGVKEPEKLTPWDIYVLLFPFLNYFSD